MPDLLRTLTVVEASRDVAVRHCGRLFALLGATVFRAPGGDDGMIGYGGDAGEAFGRWLDFGKREGEAATADLVIGGLDAAGLSAGERLSGELGAMHLEMRWFHPDGPYADWPGTDEVIQALTGLVYAFGPAEGPPTLAQGHGPQVSAALAAFNAAMGALFAQPRPRRISVCVHEAHMCLTETGAVSALMEGGLAVRLGVNRFVPTYPCGSYPTTDGWLGVTALIPAQWKAFCELIGREAMAREPRYATSVERLLLADEIDPLVADAVSKGSTDRWVQGGLERRIPLTPMADLAGLPQEPHWRQRGAFAPFDAEGRVGPTLPYRFAHRGESGVRFAGGPPSAPLRGLRVVDFSMGWAGPLCTRTLADLGADVIKIESEGHPDWWRGWETDQSGDPPPRETKYNFISVNRNKRGVVLDVTTPDGLAKAKALIGDADVFVENYAPGAMEKLGLGAEVRRALNPQLISISMPAFGLGGPLSGIRAYGSTVEQASGMPFANGRDDWAPCLQHVAFGDPIGGLNAANALLAALWGRAEHGGAEIDLAQVACLFAYAADALIAQQDCDGPLPRTGSRRPRAAPTCVVRGLEPDTWLALSVQSAEAWRGLCQVIGAEAWLEDPELATVAGRNRHADRIEAAVAAWAFGLTPDAAALALQARGVAAAPALRVDQLGYDVQLASTGFWAEMERAYVGRYITPAAPFAYDGQRPALRLPAPTLGQHTDEVLAPLR
jgi:crotonobetainyl-CoA:carnitine CoA-transferase CaiB-like acyl-CoA transferase